MIYEITLLVETAVFMAQRFLSLINVFQTMDHNLLMDNEINLVDYNHRLKK